MRKAVEEVVNKLRSSLQAKGSDVELKSVTTFGMVKVELYGECCSCISQRVKTMLDLEKSLKELVPEVKFLMFD